MGKRYQVKTCVYNWTAVQMALGFTTRSKNPSLSPHRKAYLKGEAKKWAGMWRTVIKTRRYKWKWLAILAAYPFVGPKIGSSFLVMELTEIDNE